MFLSRREFLINSFILGAEAATIRLPLDHLRSSLRIGFVGLGTRGKSNLACVATEPYARITALCDTDEKTLHQTRKLLPTSQQDGVRTYSDVQRFLRTEKTDFVVISVPPPAQNSLFCAFKDGRCFASETPISSAAAADAGRLFSLERVQLLPKRVMASVEAAPTFLSSEQVNTIQIVHRTTCPVQADTTQTLKDWLFEELGDSIDAATTLFELDAFGDCSAYSMTRLNGFRELVFRFAEKTRPRVRRLNISVIAPANLSNKTRRDSPSSDTVVTVQTNQNQLFARTIPRPPSSTRLYLSNLAYTLAENASPLLNPLSTRLASYSLISTAVDLLSA